MATLEVVRNRGEADIRGFLVGFDPVYRLGDFNEKLFVLGGRQDSIEKKLEGVSPITPA